MSGQNIFAKCQDVSVSHKVVQVHSRSCQYDIVWTLCREVVLQNFKKCLPRFRTVRWCAGFCKIYIKSWSLEMFWQAVSIAVLFFFSLHNNKLSFTSEVNMHLCPCSPALCYQLWPRSIVSHVSLTHIQSVLHWRHAAVRPYKHTYTCTHTRVSSLLFPHPSPSSQSAEFLDLSFLPCSGQVRVLYINSQRTGQGKEKEEGNRGGRNRWGG